MALLKMPLNFECNFIISFYVQDIVSYLGTPGIDWVTLLISDTCDSDIRVLSQIFALVVYTDEIKYEAHKRYRVS